MDLRAVVVDDEQLARDELGYLLGQLGGIEVIGQAGNGVEALSTIDRLHPDIVFLDVQMPGLTGFEVARRMLDTRTGSQIIFVTAYDQHAIEAFEVNAVDYLLKPVEQKRLELAVQRARRRIDVDRMDVAAVGGIAEGATGATGATGPTGPTGPTGAAGPNASPEQAGLSAQLERIVRLVTERQDRQHHQGRRERLAIKVGERFLLVQADEIIYASLSDDSIAVVTSQHVGTSNYRTLDELQTRLDPRYSGACIDRTW